MIYLLLLCHFVGDFLLQSRKIATNKSSNFRYLLLHGVYYTLPFLACLPLANDAIAFLLAIKFNTIFHLTVDAFIWNGYKWSVAKRNPNVPTETLKGSWRYWEDHWFYTTIGFDQFLHLITLVFAFEQFI